MNTHKLYYDALLADDQFSAELERVYGKRKAAEKRYATTHVDGPLKLALKRKLAADKKLLDAMGASRVNPAKPSRARRAPRRKTSAARARRKAPATLKRPYLARVKIPGRRAVSHEFRAQSDAAALSYAGGLMLSNFPAGATVESLKARAASNPKKKNNPAQSVEPDLTAAVRALEEFTGHPVQRLEVFEVPDHGAGWGLGIVCQINYIATRDGETVEYEHRFKPGSRPLLASSDDGTQLYLLGGAYRITDRGIVDSPGR